MRTGAAILCLALGAVTIGCRASRESRMERERTVIVRSTTQPSDAEPLDGRSIRVIVDDERRGMTSRSSGLTAFVGKPCRVQFRRDALGLSAIAPTPPQSEGLPNKPTYLDGTLASIAEDGVLLTTSDGVEVWIPWQSVLLVEGR